MGVMNEDDDDDDELLLTKATKVDRLEAHRQRRLRLHIQATVGLGR